ncbi:MAG: hypothetical protein CVV32_07635 [Methanomicrobiales archaeon HGW-Methanomicrobiales-3]|nr:MAG: hypothetical protein CVV32_07635 [Methanomicrobiales archaeon HGW-Methanomicrobiales-3]
MPGSSEFLFQLVGEKGIYKLSRVDRYEICRLERTGSGRLPGQYQKTKNQNHALCKEIFWRIIGYPGQSGTGHSNRAGKLG